MSVHNTIITTAPKGDFPSPIIRRMPYKSNLRELAEYRKSAPKGNREMIDKLTELYYNKKIPNYRTVENVVIRLLAGNEKPKRPGKNRQRIRQGYAKIHGRYADNRPYRATNPRK